MKLFKSEDSDNIFSEKHFYLDNDFLNLLFKNADVFNESYRFLSQGYPILDPYVTFEFLRDIYLEEERLIREVFITKDFFYPTVNHQQVFLQTQENALVLSRIYSFMKCQAKPSVVDLMLAAKIMFQRKQDPLLITGNKKDYPICVFDTIAVFNLEQQEDAEIENKGKMLNFYILRFNQKKLENCLELMEKLKKEKMK